MKHFRKHPDLLIIGNYPFAANRITKEKFPAAEAISTILIHTLHTLCSDKKIKVLSDDISPKHTQESYVRQRCWSRNPLSFFRLLGEIIYHHQTQTMCLLYHGHLFGRWTHLFTPALLIFFALTGKKTAVVYIQEPNINKASIAYASFVSLFATIIVQKKKTAALISGIHPPSIIPISIHSLKERRQMGQLYKTVLFPPVLSMIGTFNASWKN